MNAHELADKLSVDVWDEATIVGSIHLGIKMLRQQADRIAELEKDLAKYDELAIDDLEGKRIIWCDCGDAITQDSGAVCGVCASFRSTKEQSAEPVAWIKKDTLIFLGNYEFGSITIQVQKQKDDEFDIPLYTTPQIKELSDEEIERIYYKTLNRFDFARAILKKASEK